jgi:hypothetical protein
MVHDKFKFVFIQPDEELQYQDAPLLNRFEKHIFEYIPNKEELSKVKNWIADLTNPFE